MVPVGAAVEEEEEDDEDDEDDELIIEVDDAEDEDAMVEAADEVLLAVPLTALSATSYADKLPGAFDCKMLASVTGDTLSLLLA